MIHNKVDSELFSSKLSFTSKDRLEVSRKRRDTEKAEIESNFFEGEDVTISG